MENVRIIKYVFIVIIGAFFIAPIFVFSYSPETTHKGLTLDIIKFFEHNSTYKFSEKEKELIAQGAVDEDHNIRPLFHFYDPVYDRGIKGNMTSKEWSQSTKTQARFDPKYLASIGSAGLSLFRSDTDYSWDRAIYEYAHGDKDRALLTLGHTLHLLEDATVPDHTRNDAHPPFFDETFGERSPFEYWAGNNFNTETIKVSNKLIAENKKPVYFNDLNKYFDTLANYSNNNFFSKDTILSERYQKPNIIREEEKKLSDGVNYIFGHGVVDDNNFKLIRIKKDYDFLTGKSKNIYYFGDRDNLILSDYWNLLSRQAVLHGAGVVELFFDEVEEEKETLVLKKKNRSIFAKIYDNTAGAIFTLAKGLYGSSVSYDDVQNISSNQGATAVLAGSDDPKTPVVESNINTQQESFVFEEDVVLVVPQVQDVVVEEGSSVEVVVQEEVLEPVIQIENSQLLPDPGIDDFLFPIPPGAGGGGGGSVPPPTPAVPVPVTPTPVVPAPDTTAPNAPVITTPTDFSQIFSTTTISFDGSAEEDSIITFTYNLATTTIIETTVATSSVWSFANLLFDQGTSTVQIYATDGAGNTSSTTQQDIFVDTVSPSPSILTILECQYSLSTSNCFSGGTTLNLSWVSTSTDIAYHSVLKDGIVIADVIATSTLLTVSDGIYEIMVVAYDGVGNKATSTAHSVEVFEMPVVINEIAWAGTEASGSDEWIEIYNKTSKTIDVSNLVLSTEDGVPHLSLFGSIDPGGYYLIERSDDTTTSVAADLTTVFSGIGSGSGLGNSGEVLQLIHSLGGQASTTLDSTPALSLCDGGWCAGDSSTNSLSMERKNPDNNGADSSNWASNNTYTKNGTDADSNDIYGTPRARNSVNLLNVGYFCPPETSTYLEDGYYIQESVVCRYLSTGFSGNRYGDLYAGIVGSSTIMSGHFIGNNDSKTESGDSLGSPSQGDEYFIAIYEINGNIQLTNFRSFFTTGSTSPPHLNYGVLNWLYGVAP